MSVTTVDRGFQVVQYLAKHEEARFKHFVELLKPISRTTLSHLLDSLEAIGEIEHSGRTYRLAPASVALANRSYTTYALPSVLHHAVQAVLRGVSERVGHSCALFARVGVSTMKIMDAHNLAPPHWIFNSPGYEWPLVPFHGFAQVFLAYGSSGDMREAFSRWHASLLPIVQWESDRPFQERLHEVITKGYAVEYREEVPNLMRLAVPVRLPDDKHLRFVVGIAANYVYLVESQKCVEALQKAATELTVILSGKVPRLEFDDHVPNGVRRTRRILAR